MPEPTPEPRPRSAAAVVPTALPERAIAKQSERLTGRAAPRRRRWRSALWFAALAAVLTLQFWFPNLDSEVHDSYSVEDAGRKAFYELVSQPEMGLPPVKRNFGPLPSAVEHLETAGSALCLLGPSRAPTPQEWQPIMDWVKQGGAVLIAARWETPQMDLAPLKAKVVPVVATDKSKTEPSKTSDGEQSSRRRKRTTIFESSGHKPGALSTTLLPNPNFLWQNEGKIEAPGSEILITEGGQPQAVRIRYGLGTAVVVASDYLFSNRALVETEKDNAGLAVQLLKAALPPSDESDEGARIVFDEYLNATGTAKVLGVLVNPTLRPLTLQILALLVLFGMTGSRRFGGLLPRETPERRDITEHINSLGLLYYRANASQHLLAMMLDRVRQDLRLRGDKNPDPATWAAAAQRVRRDPQDLQKLLREVKLASQSESISRRKGGALLRQLAELRQAARRN